MRNSSDKPKVAVVGLGGRGLDYFAGYFARSRNVDLVAVADVNPTRRQAARERLGAGVEVLESHRALLRREEIVAVAVATDEASHAPITLDLLRAGKHVICEKPMARTAADCARMLRAARRAERYLAVGFCLRYAAFFRKMKSLVDQGAIGRVIVAIAYDAVEAGGRYYFHNRARKLKSLTLEKGVHTIDIVNWILGRVPRRVAAFGGLDYFGGRRPVTLKCPACSDQRACPEDSMKARARWLPEHFDPSFVPFDNATMPNDCVFRRDIRYNDNLVAIIDYAGGARGTYIECHFTPAYSRRFTFIGDRGELSGDSFSGRLSLHERFTDKTYRFVVQGKGDHGGGDDGQMRAWIAALRSGEPLEPDGTAGLFSTAIAEAIDRSIEEGVVVTLPAFRGIAGG